ncbi:MAG: N4-gp56 family major capsid protein [Proteobacteria bacterium]|nr:N4-gp56 family major capsid protein [Pseudomonadota bacterium]
MASTVFETDNALTKKAWDEKLFRESELDTFFSDYKSTKKDSIVWVKDELSKGQGDQVTFGLRTLLEGAGQTGDSFLEGKEEKIKTYDDSVTLEQYRHAVRRKGRLSKKRAMFSIDDEMKEALMEWMRAKKDQLCVDAILDAPTRVAYQVSGTFTVATSAATAATAMHASNTLITPKLISQIRTYARTGGMVNGKRRFMPVKPIMIGGKSYNGLIVPEDVLNDLFNNAEMQTANREARERDIDNPLFQSADLIYNGVLIRGYEKMPTLSTGGAGGNVNYGKCVFLGAQSLIWANGEREETVTETFDFGNEVGVATGMICKVKKPKFNSEDYGSIGVYVACSNISGS